MNAHILEILCYLILCCYQHSIIATSIAAVAAFAGFFRDFVHCVCMLASFGFCFGLRPSASNSVCWFLLVLATALCFCSSCLQLLPFAPLPPPRSWPSASCCVLPNSCFWLSVFLAPRGADTARSAIATLTTIGNVFAHSLSFVTNTFVVGG